jgi:hypothetical protein
MNPGEVIRQTVDGLLFYPVAGGFLCLNVVKAGSI